MFQHDARRTGKSGATGPSSSAVRLKWTYKARNWIKVQVAIGDGGIVYIGDSKFPLCALPAERLSAGRPLWCTDDGGFVNASSPAVGNPFSAGGQTIQRVHIGERNNVFWSFNGATGADLWHYKIPLDGDIHSSPLIASDGTVYMACGCVIAAREPNIPIGVLFAFEPAPPLNPDGSAQFKWRVELPPIRNSSPAARAVNFPTGNPSTPASRLRLYIGTEDGRLVAVDDFGPNQGTVAWTLELGTSTRNFHASPSIGADGTIYLGTDKGLFAVRDDGSHGTVLPGWPFTDQATGDFDTAAAISNGTLFVSRYAQTKRRFYAVAAADSATATPGTKLWSLGPARGSTSTNLAQTPSPVVGANGVVYAAIGRWVYAFDPSVVNPTNVQPLWQFELGADAISLTVGDGVLYVAAKDSKLYALMPQ
jgi:outer membrane protein assembly factor BamB